MSDEYAGDDFSGLSERLAEAYEEARDGRSGDRDRDDPFAAPMAELDEEWAVRRIVLTMVPLLAVLSVLQMVSGSVLEAYEDVLLEHPALLILVPVQIGTAGNLGSITCSRLSTQLHLGTVELSPRDPDVRANVVAVLGLALTVFVLVGVAAWAIGAAMGGTLPFLEVFTVSLVSGMALAGFVVVASLVAVVGSYRLGYNPDDTTIPVVTNVCDVTGVLILFAVVAVVL